MSTDRELLELAAKAAGYDVKPHPNYKYNVELMWLLAGRLWSPLTDDGDALRLAVKLKFKIVFWFKDGSATGSVAIYRLQESAAPLCFENLGDDHQAATRRAIVRAAAEIGKSK